LELLAGALVLDACNLQIGIILVGQRHLGSSIHLLLVLFKNSLVDLDFWWGEGWRSDKLEGLVANQLAGEPAEKR
jgi:hypothetical protein